MATLLIRNPDGSTSEQPVSGELSVGRADGNDLVLSEGGVSRRHARFFEEGGHLMVEDLGSANGTWLDGERLEGPMPLGPRAVVGVGDYEISIKAAPARRPPNRAHAPGSALATVERAPVRPARATRQLPSASVDRRAPRGDSGEPAPAPAGPLARRPVSSKSAAPVITGPTLRGLTGPWANKLYPIRDTVVVGRVAGVHIHLEDESVSRRHAELERTADGVVVRDLDSANGTLVNGAPLEGEVLLQPGDVVQFGMIALGYEVGDEAVLKAPVRRTGARAPSGDRRAVPAAASEPRGNRKLIGVAAAAVGVLLVAGIVVKATGGADEQASRLPPPPPDPTVQIQEFLSECRSYSSMEFGSEPDWPRAEAACNKALDLDPINGEATQLIKKIRVEKEAVKNFRDGERLMGLTREEEALDLFALIPKDSGYYQRVKPRAREAIAAVQKKAKDDCRRYAKGGNWAQALPRCERYMTFACQAMSEEALHPPPGYALDLWGRKLRKGWRPRDDTYLDFLRAREKQDPAAGPWMCPPVEMYKSDIEVVDPRTEVTRVFKARFPEKLLFEAMSLYWDGSGGEAVVKLQRLRESSDKVAYHAQALELLKDISGVENLFKSGSTALRAQDFEGAAAAFRDVLRIDEKLMKELAASHPSSFRRRIEQDMSAEAYAGGKHWADRQDRRRGCKVWKLGFSFYRGNADLNKAVAFCSSQGASALAQAERCGDFDAVLEFAVDGDGLAEKVAARKAELDCP